MSLLRPADARRGTLEWVRALEIIESGVEGPLFSHFLKNVTANGHVPIDEG